MRSSVSILGLYNYDNTLFANMAYPTGFNADDKATLTNNLLMELAELEVVYPDVDFMKSAIGFWSAKEVVTWNRVYSAAQEEYNPIENYDRQESSTDVTDGTRQHSGTDTSSTTVDNDVVHSGSDVTANSGTDTTTNSGTDTTTNKIASYDSTVLQTHDTSDLLHGHIESTQHGMSSTLSHGEHIATDETVSGSMTHGEKIDDDITLTHTSRIHGNIGVTTSQQMLEQELLVAPKLNIMNYIIESFKNRFCLMVY